MNEAHIHLLLNHFPIIGLFIGAGILAYGMLQKSNDVIKAAMYLIIFIAVMTIPAYLTGDGTAHLVRLIPGVSKQAIHNHAEAADSTFWTVELTGILALAYVYVDYKKLKYTTLLMRITMVVSIISFGCMSYVGYLGGKIMHKEIDRGSIVAPAAHSPQPNMKTDGDED